MAIHLDQPSYTFKLASQFEAGTPGKYLTGWITLPYQPPGTPLTLSLSCVMSDEDVPHPCYLHPILYSLKTGKRLKTEKNEFVDLKMKLHEEDIVEAFLSRTEQTGVNIFVENDEIYIFVDNQKMFISKIDGGTIVLGEKSLRIALVQPVTKSLKGEKKRKVIEVLEKLRVKVRFDGICTVFSHIVRKEPKKRKHDEAFSFAGYPVSIVCSYVNTDNIAPDPALAQTASYNNKDILSDLDIPSKVLDPNFINSFIFQSEMSKEKPDSNSRTDALQRLEVEESDWIMLPRELPIYFLSEILQDQNIKDIDMEHMLKRIRLTTTRKESVYETFGDSWRSGTLISVAQTPERLILHKFGGNWLSDAGFDQIKSRREKGEILQYFPPNTTDSDLRRMVGKSTLSRTLFYNWEMSRCMNYVVIVGDKGPIVWRMR